MRHCAERIAEITHALKPGKVGVCMELGSGEEGGSNEFTNQIGYYLSEHSCIWLVLYCHDLLL